MLTALNLAYNRFKGKLLRIFVLVCGFDFAGNRVHIVLFANLSVFVALWFSNFILTFSSLLIVNLQDPFLRVLGDCCSLPSFTWTTTHYQVRVVLFCNDSLIDILCYRKVKTALVEST